MRWQLAAHPRPHPRGEEGAQFAHERVGDERGVMNGTGLTEKALQDAVGRCARVFGWLAMHPWISVRTAPGYPDVTATRGGRLVFAELKGTHGKLSEHQEVWLAALRKVPGAEVYVWYPEDWLSGRIEEVLR